VISALTPGDAGRLREHLAEGETAVLLGSSGAGKSTIANALAGVALATQPVREHDSRGRHTTTARMLIGLPGGAWLLDTPGMRELGLWAAGGDALGEVFPEISALAAECHYADCQHATEPGCAVQAALADGRIPPERWASYEKLQRELRHQAVASDQLSALAEKRRWKAIHKAQRSHYKLKGR
jgi:ribosome biogenesis GTPase / thiamine phosphate phosphatase